MMLRSANTENPEPEKGSKGEKRETKKLSEIIFDSKIYSMRIVLGRAQEAVFFKCERSQSLEQTKFRVSEEK